MRMAPGASLFAGKSVQGCFPTEEIIPNRRKVCGGMNFHGRNHPDLQESLRRDAFPSENASLHGGIAVPGCFDGGKSIPARQKANFKMLQRPERPEQSEQPAVRTARAARAARAVRTTSGQSGQNGQSNQNNQRPERPVTA